MSAAALVADALVILGVAGITLAVWGIHRMPDLQTRVHAASKVAYYGLGPILAASVPTGSVEAMTQCALVAVLLLLSPVVGSHAIAWGDWRRHGREPGPGP